MTDPSKAAMERALELFNQAGLRAEEDAFDPMTNVRTFARYIDTVDRVAREAVEASIARGDLPQTRTGLVKLMLPDEPDAPLDAIMRKKGVGQRVRSEVLYALTAAGYTITKDAQP